MSTTVTIHDVAKQSFAKRIAQARAASQVATREEKVHAANLKTIFSRPLAAKEK